LKYLQSAMALVAHRHLLHSAVDSEKILNVILVSKAKRNDSTLQHMEINQRDDHLVNDRGSGAADISRQPQEARDPEQGANF
jgi:hypothetical protein